MRQGPKEDTKESRAQVPVEASVCEAARVSL